MSDLDRRLTVLDPIDAHCPSQVTPGMNQALLDMANQLEPAYLTGGNAAQAVDAAARQANGDLASAG